ncbi:MAG: 50S ribosomal protein L17 [Candidatus Omnitrophica bacterium]|nr:50S ribosomal protein L17 [Candidatus Omnitrophota bacterium]
MRHKIAGNKLNRFSSWRKATMRDMAKATLLRQRITTTKAKAKEAMKLVDKLITLGKEGSLAAKRRAFAILCDHSLVSDLFNKITPRFKSRNGGYTRVIPSGLRRGDNAQMVILELTEKEEVIISKPKTKKLKKEQQPKGINVTDAQIKEEKKTTAIEPKTEHSHHDVKGPRADAETPKSKLPQKGKFMGGIRKIFNKKAPGQ